MPRASCLAIAVALTLLPYFSTYAREVGSVPRFRVDRLFRDHVECFWADSTGRNIYVSSRDRLYHSLDAGRTWKKLGSLPSITLVKEIIPISRSRIFVNTSKGFGGTAYLSVDSGKRFCECLPFTGRGACAWFERSRCILFVVSEIPFQLMESKDSGISWSAVGSKIDTLKNPVICSLLVTKSPAGMKFFISTSIPAAIYICHNLNREWQKCFYDPLYRDPRMPSNREAPLVTEWGKDIIACMYGGSGSPMQRLYFSDDGGLSWRGKECPCEIWGVGVNDADRRTMWIGNFGSWPKAKPYDALQFSPNRGRTWQPVTNCDARFFWQLDGLPDRSLYAATDFGLIRVKLNE